MLETLGYKQTTAEVTGDFAWEEVFTFAESIGLMPAKVEKFTIDHLAKATFAALQAKTKDGKVYIDTLIAAGVVKEEDAIAAGLIEEKPVLEAALKSAVALGNTVVEVTFDGPVNAGAEDVTLYEIDGLTVEEAIVTGEDTVRLTTSAQEAGKKYTLTVGDVKVNFGGKAKVAGAPVLEKVTGPDTERVELEFDKTLDFVTATDKANYEIKDVEIVDIELDGDTVTLITNGLTANKTHTVKVTGVKSVDGVALKSASKSFYSKSDKVAPKVEKAEALTYTRVLVKFNEELDKETAENVENYTIDKLTVEKAELVADDSADEVERWVELTTSPQKAGTVYTVKVKGVKDTSVLGNEIVKEASAKFTGKAQDKTGPTVKDVEVLNRNKVLVTFSDASRLDFATVQNASNYEINKDITVEKAELTPDYNADTKTVILTVSDMADKTTYKLTITGVADEYGNEIKKVEKSFNYNNSQLDASKIKSVVAKSATKVEINFSKYIDPVTAKDVANYTLNNDIGTPVAAKVSDNLLKVTLTVNELTEGKTYKVTINGVQDLAGNTLKTSGSFVALTTENDIEAPEVLDITSLNQKVLRVTFSEAIKVKGVSDIQAIIKEIKEDDKTSNTTLKLGAVYEDNTVLEFTKADGFKDVEYELVGFNNVTDKAGNYAVVDEELTFWGDNSVAENVDFSWEQVNVAKYRLTFSEKVALRDPADANFEADDPDDLGMDTIWYLKKKVAVDKKAFDADINSKFKTNHGIKINNTDDEKEGRTTIVASMEDTDAPYIESVEAEYRNKVRVYFNEDIQTYGRYEISYYDANGKLKKVTVNGSKDPDNDNGVILNLTNLSLESRFTYTLKVITPVQDLANNKSEKDEEYDFPGTDLVEPDNYILGVEIINAKTIKVKAYKDISTATVKLYYDDTNKQIPITVTKDPDYKKEVTIVLSNTALRSGVDYRVEVNSMKYVFEGTADDSITFYEVMDDDGNIIGMQITYNDMKLSDNVYVNSVKATAIHEEDSDGNVIGVDYFLSNETVVKTILVERDGVTLYFYVADGATPESNYDELDKVLNAIEGDDTNYTLNDNLVVSELVIDKAFTLDLNGYTVYGDIKVTASGSVTIKKGNISGTVTLDNTALEFTNDATINNVTIINVGSSTFYNNGVVGGIVINTEKAVKIVNKGTIESAIVVENAGGTITIQSVSNVEVNNASDKDINVGGTTVKPGETSKVDKDINTVADAVREVVNAVLEADSSVDGIKAAVAAGFEAANDYGVVITWKSDKEVVKINNDTKEVTVTQPEASQGDANVVLTATIKKDKDAIESTDITFNVVVKAADANPEE